MDNTTIRVKIDGVNERLRQAREVYYREAAKCAELMLLLQSHCTHNIQQDGQQGCTIRCMVCDMAMGETRNNN